MNHNYVTYNMFSKISKRNSLLLEVSHASVAHQKELNHTKPTFESFVSEANKNLA